MAQVQSLNEYIRSLTCKAHVNFNSKKPQDIIDRLSKIQECAFLENKKKNYGSAYVYFKRWLQCVEWLKKQRLDVKIDQKKLPNNNRIKEMEEYLILVTSQIKSDYEAKYEKSLTAESNNSQNSKMNDDVGFKLPDIPKDEPQPKRETEINYNLETKQITCTQLFEILTKGSKINSKKVLIIDTRKSEEYNKLKMSFQDNLINIPGDELDVKKSLSFNYCQTQINAKVSNDTEYIVLFDSNSSVETINSNNQLNVIRNFCLEKFALNSKNCKIVLLKGGFEKWVETYPTYVKIPTNEVIPVISNNDSNNAHDNIDCYSQNSYNLSFLSGIRDEPSLNTKLYQPSNLQKLNATSSISHNSNYFSSNENSKVFSNTCQPQVTLEPLTDSQMIQHNNKNSLQYNIRMPTVVPASIPPTSMNGSSYSYENGINSKQMLLNNMKEPKVILEKVDVRSKKPLVDRSNKPGNKKTNQEIINVEKESNSRRFNSDTNDVWHKEQADFELKNKQELAAELEQLKSQTTLSKSNSLYPELPSIHIKDIDPKNKELAVQKLKSTFSEEKENIIKPQESMERINLEPSAPQDRDVDKEEICKTPLKRECNTPLNSRMKRSYSSPNLQVKKLKENNQDMEKVDRKFIPEVDRSSKPRLESAKGTEQCHAIVPKDRMLHLNPIASSACHPGITGLKNLGNSCYMNSIIQCLSNTECLARYFNDNTYTHDLKCEKNYTCVAEEVAHVIKALWRGTYKSISPFDLKVVVGHYKLQFKNHEQQDSHEFLTFLLEWMHNDLKKKSKLTYNRPLTTVETEWEKSMNSQSSMISKLFFGLLRSTVQCLYCKKNSTTYETFNSLTMSLPVSNKCTLDECMRKFVSGQKVSGWNCPNCKVPRDGEKKFDVAKLPHIIVIHLNRFGDSGGWLEKKNTAVDFPIVKFDLRPYLVSDDDTINVQSSCYNLYAISNHYGTMDRGHYMAFCKSSAQNKWYKYDDHTVTEVPQSQVKSQSSSAYLLFYTSISNDILKE